MTLRLIAFTVCALSLVACAGGDCEDGEFRCPDGNLEAGVLEECHGGVWEVHEDCAAVNMVCHEEMGHCMAETGGSMTGM